MLLSLIPRHFLALLRLGRHHLDTLVRLLFFLRHTLECGVGIEVAHHPLMQGFDICNSVHDASRAQRKGVFGVECRGYDSSLVFPCLEVRVGETDEDLGQLCLFEEVGEELHAVGAEAADVLVPASLLVLNSKGLDALLDVFCNRSADLEACGEEEGQHNHRIQAYRVHLPRIRVSGRIGDRATVKPPKPQPISTTSTSFVRLRVFGFEASRVMDSVVVGLVEGVSSLAAKAG